jgi:hypothetical protein
MVEVSDSAKQSENMDKINKKIYPPKHQLGVCLETSAHIAVRSLPVVFSSLPF